MNLRDYQTDLLSRLRSHCVAVMPTGSGKSVCIAAWAQRWGWLGMLIVAHTEEIIGQISKKVNDAGIEHDLIIPLSKGGSRSLNHPVAIASVDSLIRRDIDFSRYNFLQTDEGHHITNDNKWGYVWRSMGHAYSIAWTATPFRLDGKALGPIFTGGLVEGPNMAEMVRCGWVTPVQVYGPPAAMDRSKFTHNASGEFDGRSVVAALERDRAQIVGDVAKSYLRFAPGVRGLTFAASVKLAEAHADAYRAHGVPAAAIDGNTPGRSRYVEALRSGELLQLVVVGLFGEGTDVPEIGCVSLVRPSESAGMVWQQIGRARRPSPGKRVGVVIDHAGNIAAHGLPDFIDKWALIETDRHHQGLTIPLHTCLFCFSVFQGSTCPNCGHAPEPAPTRSIDAAAGELQAYSAEELAELAKKAAFAMQAPGGRPRNPKEAVIFKRMRERIANQRELRETMVQWGEQCGEQAPDKLIVLFQREFGMHPMKAMGLGGPEAQKLKLKLLCSLNAG
jgi:superfamily II DNA or RNA helicase